jgi:hypothetical protein
LFSAARKFSAKKTHDKCFGTEAGWPVGLEGTLNPVSTVGRMARLFTPTMLFKKTCINKMLTTPTQSNLN